MANRKKMTILFLLNKTKASSPSELARLLFTADLTGGQAGIVNAYTPSNKPEPALIYNCMGLRLKPHRSTIHIAAINPIVPHTRMGGKSFTIWKPLFSN